jgi:MFS family permease
MSLPRGFAFWLMGGLLGTLMIAAGAPSPLYGVYQATWGFSAVTLTAVFAVYAVALLGAFLVAGRLSDHLGRRPVIVAALLTEAVAMVCFAVADSTGWLYAARIVQGLATGMATGAISAALVDLAPQRNPQLAPLVNSAAPTLGLAAGALGSSLLVQYGPAPMRLVYWLLLAAFAAGIAGTLGTAEPGQRRPGALASLRPQVGVPPAARRAFASGVPALAAGWALGGLYLALGPSLAAVLLHSSNPVAGGAVIFLLTGVGAATSIACRGWSPPAAMGVGCLLLAVGVGGTVAAIAGGSAAGFFAGTAFAGTGFGLAFLGVFRRLVALAPPAGRAGLITAIYIVSYLAFSLPVIAAGIAVSHVGLLKTAEVYGLAVAALDLLAAAGLAVGIRRARAAHAAEQAAAPAADGQVPFPPGVCCPPIAAGETGESVEALGASATRGSST